MVSYEAILEVSKLFNQYKPRKELYSIHIPTRLGKLVKNDMKKYDSYCEYTESIRMENGIILTVDSLIDEKFMTLLYNDGTNEIIRINYEGKESN